jgi:glycosyltransferase involved in cell wall biosynthesis
MKILFVCEGFDSVSVVAQPWRHVFEMAKRMKGLGHGVKVLSDLNNDLPRNELMEGIPVSRVRKGFFFFDFNKLLEALNKDDVDIVNWFGGPLSALYFSRLEKSLKQNIVWNMYKGKLTRDDLKNLNLFERMSLLRDVQFIYSIVPDFFIRRGSMSSRVKSIIVWSNRLKEYLRNIGVSNERITIISSGVSVESFKPICASEVSALKKELGLNSEDPVVLYFGPVSSFRGLDVLVLAMNKVVEQNGNAKLLVLARDNDVSKMSKFLKLARRQEGIRVVNGIQSQSSIIRFLSIADVVVLPFKAWPHQEVPLTVLEAMSMGKIVISTSIWPILEHIEDGKTGILVPPNDVHQLSKKITEVISNQKGYMHVSEAARGYVEEFHDWNVILNRTLQLLEESVRARAPF